MEDLIEEKILEAQSALLDSDEDTPSEQYLAGYVAGLKHALIIIKEKKGVK